MFDYCETASDRIAICTSPKKREASPGKLGSAENHQRMRFRSTDCNDNTADPTDFGASGGAVAAIAGQDG